MFFYMACGQKRSDLMNLSRSLDESDLTNLSQSLDENIRYIEAHLPVAASFDLMTRHLKLGKTKAFFLGVNGFCKTDVLQQIFSDLQNPLYMHDDCVKDILLYTESRIGYAQTSLENSWEEIFRNVLSGPAALFIDGFDQAILIDARTYPARSIAEPDLERIKLTEVFALSLTLSLNNLSAGLSASLAGLTLVPAAVSTLACSVLFLFAGNRLGRSPVLQLAGKCADPLSGGLLIGLGIMQFFL